MKKYIKDFLFLTGVMLIFLAICVGFFILPPRLEKQKCTIPAKGIVVDFEYTEVGITPENTKIYEVPVVEYYIEEGFYVSSPTYATNKTSYLVKVGDEIDILVSPDDYNHIYVLNTDKGLTLAYVFAAIPIILILLAFIDTIRKIVILKRNC